jgi:hypothetical protein
MGSHSGGYEESCLLGYNAMYCVERQPTFRLKILPPSSGSEKKPNKKPVWKHVALLTACFHAGFFFCLFSDPEDRGIMFHRNVTWLSTDYTPLYLRRENSSNLDLIRSSMELSFVSPHFSLLLFTNNLTVIIFLKGLLVYILYIILVYTQKLD